MYYSLKRLKRRKILGHHNFKERRFVGRKNCVCVVERLNDDLSISAIVTNISPYGLALESETPFKKGEVLKIKADSAVEPFSNLHFDSDVILVETAWTLKRKSDSKYIAGFKFLGSERNLSAKSWFSVLLDFINLKPRHEIKWREYRRFPTSIPVFYDSLNANFEGNGTIVDLSLGGLSMNAADFVPKYTNLNLRIGPAFGFKQVIVSANVRWGARLEADKTHPRLGVAFNFEVPENEDSVLFQYIEHAAILYMKNVSLDGK